MNDRTAIEAAVARAIDHANAINPDKPPIAKAPETKLFGEGPLDSLGIIHLLTAVEAQIDRQLGLEIVIVSDLFEIDDHPLETVASLTAHVERVVALKRQAMQARD